MPGQAVVEPHRNVFANLSTLGVLSLWHAPSESRERFDFPDLSKDVDMLAFSPRANRLLVEQAIP